MKKSLIITGLLIGGIVLYTYVTKKAIPQAIQFVKDNFSIAISGFKVHSVNFSGVELSLTAAVTNLTSLTATCTRLKADIYYIKNGSPSPLATATLNTPFTLKAKGTIAIPNIKLKASTFDVINNNAIITDKQRKFKIVITATVNGQEFNLIQNTEA